MSSAASSQHRSTYTRAIQRFGKWLLQPSRLLKYAVTLFLVSVAVRVGHDLVQSRLYQNDQVDIGQGVRLHVTHPSWLPIEPYDTAGRPLTVWLEDDNHPPFGVTCTVNFTDSIGLLYADENGKTVPPSFALVAGERSVSQQTLFVRLPPQPTISDAFLTARIQSSRVLSPQVESFPVSVETQPWQVARLFVLRVVGDAGLLISLILAAVDLARRDRDLPSSARESRDGRRGGEHELDERIDESPHSEGIDQWGVRERGDRPEQGSDTEVWLRYADLEYIPFDVNQKDLNNPGKSFDDPANIPKLRENNSLLLVTDIELDQRIVMSMLTKEATQSDRRLVAGIDLPHVELVLESTETSVSVTTGSAQQQSKLANTSLPVDTDVDIGTRNALMSALETSMDLEDLKRLLSVLQEKLVDRFKDARARLRVDNLAGDGPSQKLRSLIEYLEYRQQLPVLLQWLADHRPDILEKAGLSDLPRVDKEANLLPIPPTSCDDALRLLAREIGKSWGTLMRGTTRARTSLPVEKRALLDQFLAWVEKPVEGGYPVSPSADTLLQWLSLRPEGAGNTWIVIHCTSDHPRALSSAVACWSWVEKLDNCGVHLKLIGSLILSKYIGEAGSNQLSRVRWDNASLMRTLKRLVQRASAIRTQDADFEMLLTDYEDATSVQDCLIRYSDGSITRLLRISRMAVDVMLDRVARKRKDRQIGSKDYLLTIGDFNGANERLTNK